MSIVFGDSVCIQIPLGGKFMKVNEASGLVEGVDDVCKASAFRVEPVAAGVALGEPLYFDSKDRTRCTVLLKHKDKYVSMAGMRPKDSRWNRAKRSEFALGVGPVGAPLCIAPKHDQEAKDQGRIPVDDFMGYCKVWYDVGRPIGYKAERNGYGDGGDWKEYQGAIIKAEPLQPVIPVPGVTISPLQSRVPKDAIAALLDRHNYYRALHKAPPLTWSDELSRYAMAWAAHGLFTHSNGIYGENIAMSSCRRTITQSLVDATEMFYNGGTETSMLWRNTTHIGAGWLDLPDGSRLVVVEYNPPGNQAV